MFLKQATSEDISRLNDFYTYVCKETKGMDENAKWNYGVYPNESMLLDFIKTGSMYYVYDSEDILGTAVLINGQEPLLEDMPWSVKLSNKDIVEIRILAVSPKQQGTGFSIQFMSMIESFVRDLNKKSIRLCVIDTNIKAENLYQKCGFSFIGEKLDTTPGVPWKSLNFYEKNI